MFLNLFVGLFASLLCLHTRHNKGRLKVSGRPTRVKKDGMVFDGLTGSAGMALSEYKSLFQYPDAIDFKPTKTISINY